MIVSNSFLEGYSKRRTKVPKQWINQIRVETEFAGQNDACGGSVADGRDSLDIDPMDTNGAAP